MEILVKGFSCNWETYKPKIPDILKRICKIEKVDLTSCKIKKEPIQLEGNSITAQRRKDIWSRSLFIYFDEDLKYIIALSNTNYDEDKQIECNKLGKKSTYGVSNYHANTYLLQGINKNFETFYKYKKKFPNLKMYFYVLDVKEKYPHNLTNLLCYRKLSTIGFDILNLDEINFKEFSKFGISINSTNIKYSSLNNFINDTIRVSNKNTGNKPSYMKVIDYDYDIEKDEEDIEENKKKNSKYVYTFKTLGAEAYDSFLNIWVSIYLANKEEKEIEFLFSSEKYNFASSKTCSTKDFPSTITSLFETIGLDVVYETTEEIRQQLEREQDQFEKAKKKNKLRNQELFRNNIRAKGMETKCCLCGCEIENILEAAHLWGVSEIKNATKKEIKETIQKECMKDLIDETNPHCNDDFYSRYVMANSGDNGIWLCKNHHGLFDNHFYCFDSNDGKIVVNLEKLNSIETKNFFDLITTSLQLQKEILTEKTKEFLSHNQL